MSVSADFLNAAVRMNSFTPIGFAGNMLQTAAFIGGGKGR